MTASPFSTRQSISLDVMCFAVVRDFTYLLTLFQEPGTWTPSKAFDQGEGEWESWNGSFESAYVSTSEYALIGFG